MARIEPHQRERFSGQDEPSILSSLRKAVFFFLPPFGTSIMVERSVSTGLKISDVGK